MIPQENNIISCHLRGCCGPKNANFPLVRISFWKAEFLISRRVRLNLANARNKIHVLYLLYVCTLVSAYFVYRASRRAIVDEP